MTIERQIISDLVSSHVLYKMREASEGKSILDWEASIDPFFQNAITYLVRNDGDNGCDWTTMYLKGEIDSQKTVISLAIENKWITKDFEILDRWKCSRYEAWLFPLLVKDLYEKCPNYLVVPKFCQESNSTHSRKRGSTIGANELRDCSSLSGNDY